MGMKLTGAKVVLVFAISSVLFFWTGLSKIRDLGDIGTILTWFVEMRRPLSTLSIAEKSGSLIHEYLTRELRFHQISGETFFLSNDSLPSCPGCLTFDVFDTHSNFAEPFDLIYTSCDAISTNKSLPFVKRLSNDGVLLIRGTNIDRQCWKSVSNLLHDKGKGPTLYSGFFHVAAGGAVVISPSSDTMSHFEEAFPEFIRGTLKNPIGENGLLFPDMFVLEPVGIGETFRLLISFPSMEDQTALEVLIPVNAYSWKQFVTAIEDFLHSSRVDDELIWRQVILKLMR
jgi:hypothetical protein